MKDISNLTELIRTLLYDVVGLLIPGVFLLTLLLLLAGYWVDPAAPCELIRAVPRQPKTTLGAALLLAYGLGYLIESVWVMHSSLLLGLGHRLIHKEKMIDPHADRWPRIFGAANVATSLARVSLEDRPFYRHTRQIIGARAKFENPEELTFTNVSALAHSFAGPQADLARQFRYKGDLCGAISTMSLLAALGIVPLLVLKGRYPWYWCSVPTLLLLWIAFLGLPLFLKPVGFQKKMVLRARYVLPFILVAVMLFLASSMHHWNVVLTLPMLVAAWFFMLWRAYFYLNLGGTIHFGIALSAIVSESESLTNRPQTSGPRSAEGE